MLFVMGIFFFSGGRVEENTAARSAVLLKSMS